MNIRMRRRLALVRKNRCGVLLAVLCLFILLNPVLSSSRAGASRSILKRSETWAGFSTQPGKLSNLKEWLNKLRIAGKIGIDGEHIWLA